MRWSTVSSGNGGRPRLHLCKVWNLGVYGYYGICKFWNKGRQSGSKIHMNFDLSETPGGWKLILQTHLRACSHYPKNRFDSGEQAEFIRRLTQIDADFGRA